MCPRNLHVQERRLQTRVMARIATRTTNTPNIPGMARAQIAQAVRATQAAAEEVRVSAAQARARDQVDTQSLAEARHASGSNERRITTARASMSVRLQTRLRPRPRSDGIRAWPPWMREAGMIHPRLQPTVVASHVVNVSDGRDVSRACAARLWPCHPSCASRSPSRLRQMKPPGTGPKARQSRCRRFHRQRS